LAKSLTHLGRDLWHALTAPEKETAPEYIPVALLGGAMVLGAVISTRPWPQLPALLFLVGLVSLGGLVILIASGGRRLILGMRPRRLACFLTCAFLTQMLGLAAVAGDGILRPDYARILPGAVFFLGALTNLALLAALIDSFYHQLQIGVWRPFVAVGVVVAVTVLACVVALSLGEGLLVDWSSSWAPPPEHLPVAAGPHRGPLIPAHYWIHLGLLSYIVLPWTAFVCALLLFALFARTKNSLPAGLFCAACLVLVVQRMSFLELWLLAGTPLPLVSFCEVSRPGGFILVGMPMCLIVIAVISALEAHVPKPENADLSPSRPADRLRLAFETLKDRLLAEVELAAGSAAARHIARAGVRPEDDDLTPALRRARAICAHLLGHRIVDRIAHETLAALPPDVQALARQALAWENSDVFPETGASP